MGSTCSVDCKPASCKPDEVCGIAEGELKAKCLPAPKDETPEPPPPPVPCSLNEARTKMLCAACEPTCNKADGKACTVAVDAKGALPMKAQCTPVQKETKEVDCKTVPPSDTAGVAACAACSPTKCEKTMGALCKIAVGDDGKPAVKAKADCKDPQGKVVVLL